MICRKCGSNMPDNARKCRACGNCPYNYYCRGGAKCQTYAACGSYSGADPGCMLTIRASVK